MSDETSNGQYEGEVTNLFPFPLPAAEGYDVGPDYEQPDEETPDGPVAKKFFAVVVDENDQTLILVDPEELYTWYLPEPVEVNEQGQKRYATDGRDIWRLCTEIIHDSDMATTAQNVAHAVVMQQFQMAQQIQEAQRVQKIRESLDLKGGHLPKGRH